MGPLSRLAPGGAASGDRLEARPPAPPMRVVYAATLALLLSSVASAQTAPAPPPAGSSCPEGTAEATLNGINVEAALFTNGNFFFGNTTTNGDGYVTPLAGPDAGSSPLFAANLWLGGIVAGEMKVAAARYTNFQLRPGQAGPDGAPPTPEACAEADRIWTLSELEPKAGQQSRLRRVARSARRARHRRRRHRGQLRPSLWRPPRDPRRRDGLLGHD